MKDELDTPIMATLEIRRNADGLIRTQPKPQEFYSDFVWVLGNYACDCNRHLFWLRAAGEPEDDDGGESETSEHRCSHDRYAVRLTDADGKVLYEDFPDQEKRA